MNASTSRIGAVIRKELAEFRRNRLIVVTAAILPVLFLASPTASVLSIKAQALSTELDKRVDAAKKNYEDAFDALDDAVKSRIK